MQSLNRTLAEKLVWVFGKLQIDNNHAFYVNRFSYLRFLSLSRMSCENISFEVLQMSVMLHDIFLCLMRQTESSRSIILERIIAYYKKIYSS